MNLTAESAATARVTMPPAEPFKPLIPRISADSAGIAAVLGGTRGPANPAPLPSSVRVPSGSRHSPTYRLHAYWSKKPHEVLRECLETFTAPGDLVLDPFCGSGGTLLVAAMLGRRAIGIDRSPAAAFISRTALRMPLGETVRAAFAALRESVAAEVEPLYATRCHRCGGPAMIRFSVIADELLCAACGGGFTADKVAYGHGHKLCPHCRSRLPRSPLRAGARVTETSAQCQGQCRPAAFRRRHDDVEDHKRAYFDRYDLGKVAQIAREPIRDWYPNRKFPQGVKTPELFARGIMTVDKLFTRRNLRALAAIRRAIDGFDAERRETLLFCLTAGLTSLTLKAQHLEGGGGYLPGMFYVPPVRKERNTLLSLARVAGQVASGADALHASGRFPPNAWAGIGTATDLRAIPDGSVDFVFLDPPYSDKIQFLELNFVWESWLGVAEEWGEEEIVLNKARGKSLTEWAERIARVAREIFRVLKAGGRAVLTYEDRRHGTWPLLLKALQAAGFEAPGAPTSFRVRQETFVQRRSSGASGRDSLVVLLKSRA